ncbi:MAG: hypothetical protein ABJA57_12430 [Ginsengibacter sp.]
MKKLFIGAIISATFFISCETLNKIPTNTTGGLFSLNGNWTLLSTSDNTAMSGSVVNVLPGLSSATVSSSANNTYCVRQNDVYWKSIKSNNGGFSLSNLVNACNGSMVYNDAQITVLTNDQVRLTGKTAAGADLVQTWNRTSQK